MATELIATVFAGLGGVGVLLWMRMMTFNRIPTWCIPAAAGIAMMAFQVLNEYNWYAHQQSLLPADVEVVTHVEHTSWWRPWSWFVPQTFRFIAADFGNAERNQINEELYRIDLYVVERRGPTMRMTTVIHCASAARADYSAGLVIPAPGEELSGEWFALDDSDRLLRVCPRELSIGHQ
jgi:hypothetical protein